MRRTCGVLLGVGILGLASSWHVLPVLAQPPAVPPAVGGQPGAQRPFLRGQLPAGLMVAADVGPTNEFTDAITLPSDRQAKKRIEAAEDCIKDEDWGNAARLLQALLDAKEDVFLQVRRQDLNGRETVHWTSVRAEANRLIGSMPAHGLQFYELQFGPPAKALLAEARKKGDAQLLTEVAQRYFHTEAGAEATNLLGTLHLDRGRYLMAALCFERLLDRQAARDADPLLLFKAALAFRRAGEANRADRTFRQLSARVGREGLRLADQTASVSRLREAFDAPFEAPPDADTRQVALYRGNASRTGVGRGSMPFLLERQWQNPTIPDRPAEQPNETKRWVLDALGRSEGRLPSFFPIATGGRVIYRDYAGVAAVDARTGELIWRSNSPVSLDGLIGQELNTDRRRQVESWHKLYLTGNNLSILFENSTVGTLSTDNSRVFFVDDLLLPPHPNLWQPFNWSGGRPSFGALEEAANQSRLMALDLATEGKALWIKGDKTYDSSDLVGSYFLGPPLPLGGKLYVLTEKNTQLRLVCLDPQKGDVLWTQTLATARDKLLMDVGRRIQAVHLAYGEGVLVCPTNAGAILGVDLLSQSLVWAHSYREGTPAATAPRPPAQPFPLPPGAPGFARPVPHQYLTTPDWKTSAPVIQDGKVVFTAPDAASLHCLNLRDGTLLWKEERKDDLYLAGVFQGKVLLVGKSACRALNLADGKQLWKIETGPPSGQGVASGDFYYLPLRKGEVCQINLEMGRIEARSPALKDESPGNLIFYGDRVISQNETHLAAFEHVEAKLARADAELRKDAHSAPALLARGELRLYQGDLAGAAADLRQALDGKATPEVAVKTKTRLYETLTELLQRDWRAGEKYLDEYRRLATLDIPANATAEEKQRLEEEQRQRTERLLYLTARGREQEGRLKEAFAAYLAYGTAAGARGPIAVPDDLSVRARPDLWVQGRIGALVARATPEQRRLLEADVAERWQTLQHKGDLDAWRQFVTVFGSLFTVGNEARLQLAERLLEENHGLEAEMHLLQLAALPSEPRTAARALDALARLMARKGLLEDAVYYYRILQRDFPNVPLRDGRTGSEVFGELATDKRFLLYLDDPSAVPLEGALRAEAKSGQMPAVHRLIPFEPRGDVSPFFQRHRLSLVQMLQTNTFQLALLDRDTGEERWTHPIGTGGLSYALPSLYNGRATYFLRGHFAVFQLGTIIYGFDLLDRKKLWEWNLLGSESTNPAANLIHIDDTGVTLTNASGVKVRLGQLGPVAASYVCLKTRDGLVALDPIRGVELWRKADVPTQTQLFGDENRVYLIEMREGGPGPGRALRGADGAADAVPDFSAAFARKQRILGGRLLTVNSDPARGLTLALYDIPSGQDVWSKTFAHGSLSLQTEDQDLAAVVEPDGKVTIIDLAARRELARTSVKPEHLAKVDGGLLLQDAGHFYIALNQPAEANAMRQGPFPNLVGMRSAPVNGMVYAFHRATGELHWHTTAPVENQLLLLDQFAELPMLVFTSNTNEASQINRGSLVQTTRTLTIEKRTGKILWDRRTTSQLSHFHTLKVNRPMGIFDLISPTITLRHAVEGGTRVPSQGGP